MNGRRLQGGTSARASISLQHPIYNSPCITNMPSDTINEWIRDIPDRKLKEFTSGSATLHDTMRFSLCKGVRVSPAELRFS